MKTEIQNQRILTEKFKKIVQLVQSIPSSPNLFTQQHSFRSSDSNISKANRTFFLTQPPNERIITDLAETSLEPPNPNIYYRDLPIQPGVKFFFDILKFLDRPNHLEIQIPRIILSYEGKIHLLKTKHGRLVTKTDYTTMQFFQKLLAKKDNNFLEKDINPFSILKTVNSVNPCKSIIVFFYLGNIE